MIGDEEARRKAGIGVLLAFTATTFLSALLLFSIQPMFAKMVLPRLGGSPSVWAVALCFFQGALLAGYCYAHVLIAKVPFRLTGWFHAGLCLAAVLFLPVALPENWQDPPTSSPYLWQLSLFTVAIGLPFMAVAANAPLIQAWFARTGHAQARDPYFLYAASNLGSLLALVGYPFILEPVFGLRSLSIIWTGGFLALIAALAFCFYLTDGGQGAPAGAHAAASDDAPKPGWKDRLQWVGLALVPAALLTAFTSYIATDVASAPLIWVMPLALYLFTFVIVFRQRALIPMPVLLIAHLVTVIFALLLLTQIDHENWIIAASAGAAAFVASSLVAHRTLYLARPAAKYLTEFYLWLSLGGVLGGLFAALIAPAIFSEVYEYPLLLALTVACRPGIVTDRHTAMRELTIALCMIIAGAVTLLYFGRWASYQGIGFAGYGVTAGTAAIAALLLLAMWQYPLRQLAAALLMCAMIVQLPSDIHRGKAQRSYFGVYRVYQSEDAQFNLLTHGTTLHGAQRIRDAFGQLVADTTPATYYHQNSPMAHTIRVMRERVSAAGRKGMGRYGIVGLGAGSLACYANPGEQWRFFEIDQVIVDIAKSKQFTYIVNCMPKLDVVLGDARLTLAKEPDQSFDLLIIDAFSSDAVPVHLMTKEALELYRDKLRPGGLAVLHISNRYLDLDSVLASTEPLVSDFQGVLLSDNSTDGSYGQTPSTVAIFAREAETLKAFKNLHIVTDFEPGVVRPWTDDASDILGPFLSK